MTISPDFAVHVEELFSGLGPISIKRMFGGAGVYAGGVMFAMVSNDTLYLRADGEIEDRFRAAGSAPFVYTGRDGRELALGYWSAPDEALEGPDEAEPWGRLSLEAALRKQARKGRPKPRRRPPP